MFTALLFPSQEKPVDDGSSASSSDVNSLQRETQTLRRLIESLNFTVTNKLLTLSTQRDTNMVRTFLLSANGFLALSMYINYCPKTYIATETIRSSEGCFLKHLTSQKTQNMDERFLLVCHHVFIGATFPTFFFRNSYFLVIF